MGTVDRRPYKSASVLNQALLDQCQDNLTNRLEMTCEIYGIGDPAETLYFSDFAKYAGGKFYEPRVRFPVIERTIGDWLSGELEFSGLEITVNNSDSKYSHLLPGGSSYNGFIGRRISVKIGLGENASTYTEVFSGEITDVGGFSRDTSSFSFSCRSDFERVNRTIPDQTLTRDDFPYIEDGFAGLSAPIIYGDWTSDLRPEAPEVPAYPVNGLDPLVSASLDPVDPGAGDTPLRLVVSSSPIKSIDLSSVTLRRGNTYLAFSPSDVSIVSGTDNTILDIVQKNLIVDGNPWIYEQGDEFYLKCVGVDLGGFESNLVLQAKDILTRYGGLSPSDFDASWLAYSTKSVPSQSAIFLIRSRVWLQEQNKALSYVLSMLEQVRLECFVNRLGLFEMSSLHFEDFNPSPSFSIRNWDVVRGSFRPSTDDRNQFNRAKADYSFSPASGENRLSTAVFKNDAAIAQAGRQISKLIVFPNLVIESDVEAQISEMLKMASSYFENIEFDATPRSFLRDLSDDVILDVNIGSVDFSNVSEPVTGRIRKIGYSPDGKVIPLKIWCFQMIPFPGSLKTGVSGITGGSSAAITKEV